MKRPNDKELQQLQSLRNHKHVLEYLDKVEQDIMDRLVTEESSIQVNRAQGAISIVRDLRKFILS